MATSTFGKEFKVKSEKAKGFAYEMTRRVAPTLNKDFKTNFVHEENMKDILQKVLK